MQNLTTQSQQLPRGLRNNNPLNIRYNRANAWAGRRPGKQDKEFEEFTSIVYGFRAAIVIIRHWIRRRLCDNLQQIIARWAPATENDVAQYVRFVSNISGVEPTKKLSDKSTDLIYIVRAMAIFECGIKYADEFSIERINKAWSLALNC